MERVVIPELLDTLAPNHELAKGSRTDIHRLNRLMGSARILARAMQANLPAGRLQTQPVRVVDLGAGEGLLMLDVARQSSAAEFQLTLVDRHHVVAEETWRELAALGWRTDVAATDLLAWLEKESTSVDVMFANLVLHHFREKDLKRLLRGAAARTNLFIACEPRRSSFPLAAARWVRLFGCNAVTRHDAPVSVRAGFVERELSSLWPAGFKWELTEKEFGLFGHFFMARRKD